MRLSNCQFINWPSDAIREHGARNIDGSLSLSLAFKECQNIRTVIFDTCHFAEEWTLIDIRLADQTDILRWDSYVLRSATSSAYQLMGWGLAVEAAYGHKLAYLVAERRGEICGVLPICRFSLPLMKGFLCSLPYCDVGGCVSDDPDTEARLIDAASKMVDGSVNSSLEIRSRIAEPLDIDGSYEGKVSMLLELPESPEDLFGSFRAKLRSQIRKAEKNGLTFRTGRGSRELDQFYSVLSVNMRDLGSPVHSKKWFESIRDQYGERMTIGIVSKDDVPIGSGMLLCLDDSAAIPWASTLSKFNRLAPNMLLYWGLLKYATLNRCKTFDFGRSSYGEGTYRFKKQWGCIATPLRWTTYRIHDVSTPNRPSGRTLRRILETVWTHLPLSITNRIGPRIRKYISL